MFDKKTVRFEPNRNYSGLSYRVSNVRVIRGSGWWEDGLKMVGRFVKPHTQTIANSLASGAKALTRVIGAPVLDGVIDKITPYAKMGLDGLISSTGAGKAKRGAGKGRGAGRIKAKLAAL